MTDPYADLRIDKTATPAAIKAAYRTRAKETHPDNGGDRDEFERVQAAYDLLSSPQRRLTYDKTGRTEEPKEAQDTAALSILAGLIEGFIGADNPDLFAVDLVELMRDKLDQERDAIIAKMVEYAAAADRIKRLMKRFKRKRGKTGPDFVTPIFQRRLDQTLDAGKQCELHLKNLESALQLLEDWQFIKDDLSAHPAVATGMMRFAFVRR